MNKQTTRRTTYNILSVTLIRRQVLTFSELTQAYGRKSRKSFIDHHIRILASCGLFVIVIGQRGSEVLVPNVYWPGRSSWGFQETRPKIGLKWCASCGSFALSTISIVLSPADWYLSIIIIYYILYIIIIIDIAEIVDIVDIVDINSNLKNVSSHLINQSPSWV